MQLSSQLLSKINNRMPSDYRRMEQVLKAFFDERLANGNKDMATRAELKKLAKDEAPSIFRDGLQAATLATVPLTLSAGMPLPV
jgi:hypothetical protein